MVQGIDGRAALSREYAMGERCACCGLRYWLWSILGQRHAVMIMSHPQTKFGLLDMEISQLGRMSRSQPCRGRRVLPALAIVLL